MESENIVYPELPPGHEYRGENQFPFNDIVQENDIDIMLTEDATGTAVKWSTTYLARLRAWVDVDRTEGVIRNMADGEHAFKQQFESQQEALNVIVTRLWLGMTEKE